MARHLQIFLTILVYGVLETFGIEFVDIKGKELINNDLTNWEYNPEKSVIQLSINEQVEVPIPIAEIFCKECPEETLLEIKSDTDITALKLKLVLVNTETDISKWSLSVNGKMDYESMPNIYPFDVRVGKSLNFFLSINNLDDKPPRIEPYENTDCSVKETPIGVGETGCRYKVTDPDGNNFIEKIVIDFSKVSSEEVNQKFDIKKEILEDPEQKNPELTKYIKVTLIVKKPLDFDQTLFYSFNLRAKDTGDNTDEFPISVYVEDVRNKPPKWTSIFSTQTFEEESIQTFSVKAVDGDTQVDPPSPIEYRIKFISPDEQLPERVLLDPTTGEINVNKIDRDTLKKEDNDIVEFVLTAVELEESCEFPENSESCDTIEEGDGDQTVCVERCKGKWIQMQSEASATFIIRDINDNPAMVAPLADIIIPENMTLIYNDQELNISDIDEGINAKCDLKLIDGKSGCVIKHWYEAENPEGAFQLIPSTGFATWSSSISIVQPILDYEIETMRNFTLLVHTEDFQKNETCDTQLRIIVENRNDEIPVFENCTTHKPIEDFQFEHPENVTKGTIIGTICAVDRDVGDSVTYDFVGISTKESFDIGTETGTITTKKNRTFDFEKMPVVVIQVKATDTLVIPKYNDPLHTVFATVTINVIDVNDKPPKIQLNGDLQPILENIAAGTVITGEETEESHLITAQDPDTKALLTFSIVWEESWATKLGRKVIPRDFQNCLSIKTISNDHGSTRNVYASLIVQQNGTEPDPVTGEPLPLTIDYERYEFIYLKIKVTDEKQEIGKNFDTVTISIMILDENDNPPIFDQSTIKVSRSVTEVQTSSRTTIGTIVATDRDGPEYNKVYYDIIPDNENSKYQNVVGIEDETGELYLKEGVQVDADIHCHVPLTYKIRATDRVKYNTYDKIDISIIDTNNKPPVWTNPFNQTVAVYENETDLFLETLTAADADCEELFHTVVFVLNDVLNQDLPRIFNIDKYSGKFSVHCKDNSSKCMDRDGTDGTNGHDFYDIFIQLQDNNGTGDYKTGEAKFKVPVLDVNDHAPELHEGTLNDINENTALGFPIGTIKAIDIDKPNTPNSQISYEISAIVNQKKINEVIVNKPLLLINEVSGVLKTNANFRDYYGTIIVNITARDHGVPQFSGTKNYTFQVSKYNFEKPRFIFPTNGKVIALMKKQKPSSTLITSQVVDLENIKATDDQNEKYDINFKVVSETPKDKDFLFTVKNFPNNKSELQITRNRKETDPNEYEIILEASHDGKGANSTNNSVQIKIQIRFADLNDEPSFKTPSVSCKFHEEFTNETCWIPAANDLKNNPIYYYLYKSDKSIFYVNHILSPEHGTGLRVKKGLDIEDEPTYFVQIRASSIEEEPAVAPKNPASIINVTVGLVDINNHPPVFQKKLWAVGLSEQDEPNKVAIIKLNATDVDEVDQGKLRYYMISNTLTIHGDNLKNITNPFNVYENGEIFNNFKPVEGMLGYFEFEVQVVDTPPEEHKDNAKVKVSIISEVVRVSFRFNDTPAEVSRYQNEIEQIFYDVFKYQCTIDSINQATDESGAVIPDQSTIKVHFMNENEEPVDKEKIKNLANDLKNIAQLQLQFQTIGLHFLSNKDKDNPTDDTEDKLNTWKIVFIVVTVLLSAICVGLLLTCIFKTRSLSRRLNALSVPAFEPFNSDLNKFGTANAPGTNKHAIDANPVWNTEIKHNLDNISQGSGDSELIGIEDSKDFENFSSGKEENDNQKVQKITLNPLAAPAENENKDNVFL